ncbi:MAG: epimerase [delta proteobacterium ML8_F1]|nr:MAG: epimerase [delta proteobacterium ML8_F1]
MVTRVFITGGAGFLGINLVRYLLERDYEVVSYDIADFDYPERHHRKLRILKGDIRDSGALLEAMRDSDMVVHGAAALPLYSEEDIFSTEVDGTLRVLEAAETLGIQRCVMISSTAVYGVPDKSPLYEEDPLVGVGPYGKAKIAAEKHCLDFRERGMCVPVIRPKSFIGPERLGVFALLYDWARDGRHFPVIGRGDNKYQLLDVYDLCQAIEGCLTLDRHRVNDTFNIGAESFTTIKEDFQAVLEAAGHGRRVMGFWAAPVIMLLRVLAYCHLSPIYQWVYETASKDSVVAVTKAKKQLDFNPVYSNKEALVRNYLWYLEHYEEFKAAEGISHRVPWKQGILKLAKQFF